MSTCRPIIVTANDLRAELATFEHRYGVPSERMQEAFRDENGALVETADFHRWCAAYASWELARGRMG